MGSDLIISCRLLSQAMGLSITKSYSGSGVVIQVFDFSFQRQEQKELWVLGLPDIYSEFSASQETRCHQQTLWELWGSFPNTRIRVAVTECILDLLVWRLLRSLCFEMMYHPRFAKLSNNTRDKVLHCSFLKPLVAGGAEVSCLIVKICNEMTEQNYKLCSLQVHEGLLVG